MWDGYEINYDLMVKRIVDMKVTSLYKSLNWEYKYAIYKGTKKEEEILFEDGFTQEELW